MKSQTPWKLRTSRVFKNQVSFGVGPCDIVLKISPTHLKVFFDPESGTSDVSKVKVTCEETYKQIPQAMRTVTRGYRECDYYFAFPCTRPECKTHPHPAKIQWDSKTLECRIMERQSELPNCYELWIPQQGSTIFRCQL